MLKIGEEFKEVIKNNFYEPLYVGKFQGVGSKINISNIRNKYKGLRIQLAINENIRDLNMIEIHFNANELIDLGTIRFNGDASLIHILAFRLKVDNTGIEIIKFDEISADNATKIINTTNYQITKIEGIK